MSTDVFPPSIQTSYCGTNMSDTKIQDHCWGSIAHKTIEQTCAKSAIPVHVFSKLGDVCMYTGPLNLKSEFPTRQNWQVLAYEYCSLKSNKLFKNSVAAHSCSATKVTCLTCRDPRKRVNRSLWLERKFLKIFCPYIHSRILWVEPFLFYCYLKHFVMKYLKLFFFFLIKK